MTKKEDDGGFWLAMIGFLLLILFTFAWISTNDDQEPSDQPTQAPTSGHLGTGVQPIPSWMIGMDPGCFDETQPVAGECLEGGAPMCRVADSVGPCWWRDDRGDLWFRS